MKSYSVTIKMKAVEQYFPVVLFIILYMVFLTFESVDAILQCDHLNKLFIMLYKVILTFESVDNTPKCDHSNKRCAVRSLVTCNV